jgi:hypothetical protein
MPIPSNPEKDARRLATRKRSDRHERRTATDVAGRRTSNSGAGADKGDVKSALVRVECKTTAKKSYILRLIDLEKISDASPGQIPILAINFEGDLAQEFYVIPKGWALQLLEKSTSDSDNS